MKCAAHLVPLVPPFGNQNYVNGQDANAFGDGNAAFGRYAQVFGDTNEANGNQNSSIWL